MNVIGHHYRAVQRAALGVSPDTRFQNNHASFRGQDPSVVRTERYENAFIVALIVRKMTAVFVDSLHVGHEYHKGVARARTPAPTSWLAVSKWDWARQMIMRKIDVVASVSPQPIHSRCRRERLARATNYARRGKFGFVLSSYNGSAIFFSSG